MSWPFRSERGIGRGEVAESRIEAPMLALFALVCAVGLFIFHIVVHVNAYTIAMAVSMLIFGVTLVRVEFGLYVLIVAMLLSPEITAGSVGAHAERSVNLRYDDILIPVIFLGVLTRLAFEGSANFWRDNPVNIGILAYYGVCLVSSTRAIYFSYPAWDKPVAAFELLKMLEFYMVFFMFWMSVRTRDEVRRQLTVFFGVSLIVCAYGIISIGTLPRVSAPFEAGGTEPNTFGGYLMLIICVAIGMYSCAPTRGLRWSFLLITALAFIPFVMTLSRASYASLFVALLALGVLGRKWAVLGLVGFVLLVSPLVMPAEVRDRVTRTFEPGAGVPIEIRALDEPIHVDSSTWERIYIWEKVKFNLTVWPILGGGVSWETVVDSQYARVLIETGILGMVAFAFLALQLFRTSRQAFRWSRDWMMRGFALGCAASVCGLIVHGLATISFLIVRIMEPFWFMMAICVVARHLALEDYHQRLRAYYADLQREREAAVENAKNARPAQAS